VALTGCIHERSPRPLIPPVPLGPSLDRARLHRRGSSVAGAGNDGSSAATRRPLASDVEVAPDLGQVPELRRHARRTYRSLGSGRDDVQRPAARGSRASGA
jgi:hypothetical protein